VWVDLINKTIKWSEGEVNEAPEDDDEDEEAKNEDL